MSLEWAGRGNGVNSVARGENVGGLYHTPSRVIIAADLVVKDNADAFYLPEAAY